MFNQEFGSLLKDEPSGTSTSGVASLKHSSRPGTPAADSMQSEESEESRTSIEVRVYYIHYGRLMRVISYLRRVVKVGSFIYSMIFRFILVTLTILN